MNPKTATDPLLVYARQTLSTSGGRMTEQRRLILDALAHSPDHPTAEELYRRVKPKNQGINLSTIYRTLRWLEQEGLVNSYHFEGEPHQDRFDPVVGQAVDHHHFRCRNCSKIIEFDAPQLEAVSQMFIHQHGGQIDSGSIVFYGLCAECAEAEKSSTPPPAETPSNLPHFEKHKIGETG